MLTHIIGRLVGHQREGAMSVIEAPTSDQLQQQLTSVKTETEGLQARYGTALVDGHPAEEVQELEEQIARLQIRREALVPALVVAQAREQAAAEANAAREAARRAEQLRRDDIAHDSHMRRHTLEVLATRLEARALSRERFAVFQEAERALARLRDNDDLGSLLASRPGRDAVNYDARSERVTDPTVLRQLAAEARAEAHQVAALAGQAG